MADRYLLETSLVDGYQLEDGSGVLILEGAAAAQEPKTLPPANPAWSDTAWRAAIAASGRYLYPPPKADDQIFIPPARFNPEWSKVLWYSSLLSMPRMNFPPIQATATAATAQVRMLAALGAGS